MEKKFTPGILFAFNNGEYWEVKQLIGDVNDVDNESKSYQPQIAMVNLNPYTEPKMTAENQEANANLFSSAPDLLEALEDIISLAEYAYESSISEKEDEDITIRINKAKQAINKAYGINK